MKNGSVYRLAESTLIEPLVNSWSAWPYLIAPVPASLHLLQYQVPLLQSYIEDPISHTVKSQDPAFAGGGFINISADRVSEGSTLLKDTMSNLSHNLEFAQSLLGFQNWL